MSLMLEPEGSTFANMKPVGVPGSKPVRSTTT